MTGKAYSNFIIILNPQVGRQYFSAFGHMNMKLMYIKNMQFSIDACISIMKFFIKTRRILQLGTQYVNAKLAKIFKGAWAECDLLYSLVGK